MAVVPMQRISIYALRKNRKELLELLQRRGVMEISDCRLDDDAFEKADTMSAQSVFEKNISVANGALETLGQYVPEDKPLLSMLHGRKELSVENYYTFVDDVEEIMRVAYRITALQKTVAEQNAEIARLESQMDSLIPWMELDIPMRFKGTRYTAGFVGALPQTVQLSDLLRGLKEREVDTSALEVEIVSQSQEQTCIFALCPASQRDEVEEGLRALGFSKPPTPSKTPPRERRKELKGRIQKMRETIEVAEREIKSYVGERNALKFIIDYYIMRVDKYKVIENLLQTKRVFIVTGYIPKKIGAGFAAELSHRFDLAVELEEPGEKEDVPVLLHNNRVSEGVEPVLETYSLPGKREVDPVSIMSIFYYFMFGMMLSDAAYGLIMVVACGIILKKFRDMESGMRKSIKMFFFCGVSTLFWGIMFGSYFGDVVDVVSQTFFGVHLTIPPLWFAPIDEPMQLLMFSFLVGIIHLFTGLGVQFYQLAKQGKWWDAVCDVVFWYLLVGGGIFFLLSTEMFANMANLSFILPPVAGTIAAVCAGVGALGILCTAGRSSKSVFKKVAKGLYGLYNVSGWLSDILSYSRLLALGLATGVIATVFNKLGSMMGGGVVGAIFFLVVFAVGHTMNIGINLLGAYVHSNRLEFVEFFGKFYEGGGRKFSPFALKTKYYKIKEEINHE